MIQHPNHAGLCSVLLLRLGLQFCRPQHAQTLHYLNFKLTGRAECVWLLGKKKKVFFLKKICALPCVLSELNINSYKLSCAFNFWKISRTVLPRHSFSFLLFFTANGKKLQPVHIASWYSAKIWCLKSLDGKVNTNFGSQLVKHPSAIACNRNSFKAAG